MGEIDFYYAIEKHPFDVAAIHKISVGVRHIGLNAHVRSMLAFGTFERERVLSKKEPLTRTFRVLSSGQYAAELTRPDSDVLKFIDHAAVQGTAIYTHDSPKDFYVHVGYDRTKKRYVQSV